MRPKLSWPAQSTLFLLEQRHPVLFWQLEKLMGRKRAGETLAGIGSGHMMGRCSGASPERKAPKKVRP